MIFQGNYTALVTPLKRDLSIDETALRELVDFQIKSGVNGLVPMGTTGESPTMSQNEHLRVIEIVVEQSAGRIPVIAGTGSNCTEEAIEYTRIAAETGADASLQVAPYYNKPTQEGFYRHFMSIADNVNLPMMLYNIQSRCSANIESSTLLRLARHENIVAVKEASGSFPQVMEIIADKPDDFAVFSGDDNLAVPYILMGGSGLVSVASNLLPVRISQMVRHALDGKTAKALEIHYALFPFFKSLFIETNPIPIKYYMKKAGMLEEIYRLPMCELSDANRIILDQLSSRLALF